VTVDHLLDRLDGRVERGGGVGGPSGTEEIVDPTELEERDRDAAVLGVAPSGRQVAPQRQRQGPLQQFR
jgi:hypothetical protein